MSKELDLTNQITTTNDITKDIETIVEQTKSTAVYAVNIALLQRNWLIGKRIDEEVLNHDSKDNYGKELIKKLSQILTKKYGKGFDSSNLRHFRNFYILYKNIFDTLCRKSFLTWSHYRELISIKNEKERRWYEDIATKEFWSVRTLQHHISTDAYGRTLTGVSLKQIDIDPKEEAEVEFVRNPVVLKMFGLPEDEPIKEKKLEEAILNHIEKFMMELGKGYAFVGRQKRIKTDWGDHYIDLVFFNYCLNCFVLVELKIGKLKHSDIGQLDSYVRMYDDLVKEEHHNPTIGILLCDEIGPEMVQYSFLKDVDNIFATKYQYYIPSKERLKAEITYQKNLFLKQQKKGK